VAIEDKSLLETCHARSIALLKRNLTPAGILAASPGPKAEKRGYTAVFGRDAAVCAIGMAVSGDRELQRAAAAGLHTLAAHQAPNGQIAKFVDLHRQEPDFWYLGCIDSTLWWLIALAFLDGRLRSGALRRRYAKRIRLAVQWLLAQEHQRFFLLQQNEASDWADIMPRSGFVLYTNALWYFVKRLYGIAHTRETYGNFNGLFHPFSAGIALYRRARLLNDYALRRTRDAPPAAHVNDPYPVRAVTRPIKQDSALWRAYMSRHRQNHVWQYHNGGIWPMVGGFWIAALAAAGRLEEARAELVKLARACALGNWAFTEWLHGKTLRPRGMPGQSWNAAAFLMAEYAVSSKAGRLPLFRAPDY
jgi:glycogen debranching enzyme